MTHLALYRWLTYVNLTGGWGDTVGMATLKRIAWVVTRASANWLVIEHFTEGSHTTRPRTWIDTPVPHTVKVAWAISVNDALWSAGHVRIAIMVRRTSAHCHTLLPWAFCIDATTAQCTGIGGWWMGHEGGSWKNNPNHQLFTVANTTNYAEMCELT